MATTAIATKNKTGAILSPVSNDAEQEIQINRPYTVIIGIQGATRLLFHRWSCDTGTPSGTPTRKGSKKFDNLETYVYRDTEGGLALPGEYLRQSIIHAAKFQQDPRSPRKSAMDLFRALVVPLDEFMPLGTDKWDGVDRRRAVVQRSGITRERLYMETGWKCEGMFQILDGGYVTPERLQEALSVAGRMVGVGDFRPTFGRFNIVKVEMQKH